MANEEIKIRNVEHVLHVTTDLFLENGIEGTTKEMISRESGLSRKSIDRYFYDKEVCVLEAAEWIGRSVWHNFNSKYSKTLFENEKHTGADVLIMYLNDLKKIFINKPRVFVFYSEFKLYCARHNTNSYEKNYRQMLDTIGCKRVAEKIFNSGINDGSLKRRMDVSKQVICFCKSCFGFLSSMAIDYEYQPEATISQIDTFIDGMIDLYCTKAQS